MVHKNGEEILVKNSKININTILNKKCFREFTIMDLLFIAAIFVLGVLIRGALFRSESKDYILCLKPWINQMKEFGGLSSLQYEVSNYTTPYTFFLACISYLPWDMNFLIKSFSCFFDVIMAITASIIVYVAFYLQYVKRKIFFCNVVF